MKKFLFFMLVALLVSTSSIIAEAIGPPSVENQVKRVTILTAVLFETKTAAGIERAFIPATVTMFFEKIGDRTAPAFAIAVISVKALATAGLIEPARVTGNRVAIYYIDMKKKGALTTGLMVRA